MATLQSNAASALVTALFALLLFNTAYLLTLQASNEEMQHAWNEKQRLANSRLLHITALRNETDNYLDAAYREMQDEKLLLAKLLETLAQTHTSSAAFERIGIDGGELQKQFAKLPATHPLVMLLHEVTQRAEQARQQRELENHRIFHPSFLLSGDATPFLVIAIPTVPRAMVADDMLDYLAVTVNSIAEQLPPEGYVKILVMNHMPGKHSVFNQLVELHRSNHNIMFKENLNRMLDPYKDLPEPDDHNNPESRPGSQVRQQTCDVISLLAEAKQYARYVMLIEDDFPICPNAMKAIIYAISKATAYQAGWSGMRASYGGNGVIIPRSEINNIIDFIKPNIHRLPVDLLMTQWMCGYTTIYSHCNPRKKNFVFRWNLFKHIGHTSSLRETNWGRYPPCWTSYSSHMWESDSFNEKECPEDDIWPCKRDGIIWPSDPLDYFLVDRFNYYTYWIRATVEGDSLDVSLQKRSLPLLYSGPQM